MFALCLCHALSLSLRVPRQMLTRHRGAAAPQELSPFKLGQIKELIGEINHSAGLFVAPVFVTLQIIFLLAFVGYLVVAIFALVSDFEAASDACAHESWVWLFSLLAVAIPSGLGLVMGIVKATLKLANLRARFGWEVPPALLSFAAPCSYIALGTLGILLWVNMSASCAASYAASYALLFVIFKIQVIMLGLLLRPPHLHARAHTRNKHPDARTCTHAPT